MSYACFDKKDESDCLDVTDTVCLSQSVSIAEHWEKSPDYFTLLLPTRLTLIINKDYNPNSFSVVLLNKILIM